MYVTVCGPCVDAKEGIAPPIFVLSKSQFQLLIFPDAMVDWSVKITVSLVLA